MAPPPADRDPWSAEPTDPQEFTARFDRFYTRAARLYAIGVRLAPIWRSWLRAVLPHIRGPRVLEVSFGTGWLLTQYAGTYETYGVDLNAAMATQASRAVQQVGIPVRLVRGDVTALPYADGRFDTIVNTMAFTGYPDGAAAMAELHRVLASNGRIVMVDVGLPADSNRVGTALARAWQRGGDILRDMPALLDAFDFDVITREVGGRGSIHLHVAEKH